VFGYLYWFGVLPFHEFVFGNMAKRIASAAEARSNATVTGGPHDGPPVPAASPR
jgi:hypothetical protein